MPPTEPISQLFDRLDAWRHLPNYQLERRADIFFSLYLSEVLEKKLGFSVSHEFVAEFPVRIGTIYPHIPTDKSYKIDYLAMSTDGRWPIFVELKTEGDSRRLSQDHYLAAASVVGLGALLNGVIDIFRVTSSRRKYYTLLLQLEQMGLIEMPPSLAAMMMKEPLDGVEDLTVGIKVRAGKCETPRIMYIQPVGAGPDVITLEDFANVVDVHKDVLSRRFAMSLREWSRWKAGQRRPDGL